MCVFRWQKKYSIEDALKMIMDGNSSDMKELGEDDDDEKEKKGWTPTAKIGENQDSSDDDESQKLCLKQRGIYYIDTVQMNRVKNCPLMDEKELKTKGRGSLDFRVNQEEIM